MFSRQFEQHIENLKGGIYYVPSSKMFNSVCCGWLHCFLLLNLSSPQSLLLPAQSCVACWASSLLNKSFSGLSNSTVVCLRIILSLAQKNVLYRFGPKIGNTVEFISVVTGENSLMSFLMIVGTLLSSVLSNTILLELTLPASGHFGYLCRKILLPVS